MEFKIDLDSPRIYQELDPAGMLHHILYLPKQCRDAWESGLSFQLPSEYRGIRQVVLSGMGGSAIGGDLLKGIASLEGLPVFVFREYSLPPLDENTLVIFSSYSGMTEETLSCFEQSLKSPAKKLAITTGGRLKKMAKEEKIPCFLIPYEAPPRAALGYIFVSLLAILQNLGLIKDKTLDMKEAIEILEGLCSKLGEDVPISENLAKILAQRIFSRLVIIYGADFLGGVARRWKTQINENSKSFAFFELLPEIHHNSVVGYHFPSTLKDKLFFVLLFSPSLPERLRYRYELTCQLLKKAGLEHEVISGKGKSILSQILSLILIGDFVSYYLALLNRIDPSPTPEIDFIKTRLSQFRYNRG